MEHFLQLNESEKNNKIFELLLNIQQQQNNQFHKLECFINDLKEIKTMNEKIILNMSEMSENIKNLQKENQTLKSQLNCVEQETYNKYSTILGLPEIKNVQLDEILQKLSHKIEFSLNKNKNLKECYIKKENENKSHIVLRFFDERDKIAFTEAFKTNAPITNEDLIRTSKHSKLHKKELYIKDKLSSHNQQLKKICKKYLDKEFKFVWDANGKILVREGNNSKIIHINSIEKLVNVIKEIRERKQTPGKPTPATRTSNESNH